MKRLLIFEFICGGGCYLSPTVGVPDGPLFQEGQQMLQALLDESNEFLDQQDPDTWEVVVPLDSRVREQAFHWGSASPQIVRQPEELPQLFDKYRGPDDFLLLVAPEIEDSLAQLVARCKSHANHLISPGIEVVQLASDKLSTYQWLTANDIATPKTFSARSNLTNEHLQVFGDRPVVTKPSMGAGSLDVIRHDSAAEAFEHFQLLAQDQEDYILQEFVAGISASIALVRTQNGDSIYPGMLHQLEAGSFKIEACQPLIEGDLQQRSMRLIERVASLLPDFCGYLGVDLILGGAADGSQDVVIEINPRLTTSFCTARQMTDFNIFQKLVG